MAENGQVSTALSNRAFVECTVVLLRQVKTIHTTSPRLTCAENLRNQGASRKDQRQVHILLLTVTYREACWADHHCYDICLVSLAGRGYVPADFGR